MDTVLVMHLWLGPVRGGWPNVSSSGGRHQQRQAGSVKAQNANSCWRPMCQGNRKRKYTQVCLSHQYLRSPLGVLASCSSPRLPTRDNHFPDFYISQALAFLHSLTPYVWSLNNILLSFGKMSSKHIPCRAKRGRYGSNRWRHQEVRQSRMPASEAGLSSHERLWGYCWPWVGEATKEAWKHRVQGS